MSDMGFGGIEEAIRRQREALSRPDVQQQIRQIRPRTPPAGTPTPPRQPARTTTPTAPARTTTPAAPPRTSTPPAGGGEVTMGMPAILPSTPATTPEMDELRNEIERLRQTIESRPQFNRESYRDIVRNELRFYGLEELTDTVVASLQEYDQIGPDLFMAKIRDTETYRQRFRGNQLLRDAGMNVLSEAEYVATERAYSDLMRNAGLPQGYYDAPEDFANLIGGGVSPAELSARIIDGYRELSTSDQTVRDQMRQLYGLTDGEMVAYFLDPERALPVIERQVATARIGAAAARQGFENVVEREALERMASLGVSEQQAGEVFGTLANARELLTPIEAGETALDVTETAMGLAGQSPEALQRLRTQQRRRQARFEGGGQLATTAAGVTGLREA